MARLHSIISSLRQFIVFMRRAENVAADSSGQLTGNAGGTTMTANEAKVALRQLVEKEQVTRRELAIAVRDITGLKSGEKTKLTAALRTLGRPDSSGEYTDIRSGTNGKLNGQGVREFIRAYVRLSARFTAVTYVTEGTDGGRRNYSLQADNSRPGPACFDARRAERVVEFLKRSGNSKGQIRSAASAVPAEAKALLLEACAKLS